MFLARRLRFFSLPRCLPLLLSPKLPLPPSPFSPLYVYLSISLSFSRIFCLPLSLYLPLLPLPLFPPPSLSCLSPPPPSPQAPPRSVRSSASPTRAVTREAGDPILPSLQSVILEGFKIAFSTRRSSSWTSSSLLALLNVSVIVSYSSLYSQYHPPTSPFSSGPPTSLQPPFTPLSLRFPPVPSFCTLGLSPYLPRTSLPPLPRGITTSS